MQVYFWADGRPSLAINGQPLHAQPQCGFVVVEASAV
jgi:hypothetical protein